MSEFAPKIAAIFGLADDATEDQILTAAHAALAKQIPADHIPVTAARLAELEQNTKVPPGHTVVAHGVIEDLESRASRASQLADELGELKFESAFSAAVAEGRATPAQKYDFQQIFKADQKLALSTLANLLPVVVTAARGDSGYIAAGDSPEGIDQERYDLDRKVKAYMRTHSDVTDYMVALERVTEQEGQS